MFYDLVTIKIKAGDGGDGALSFRKEKYRPMGGPDGGNGGKGGSVFIKVNTQLNTLSYFVSSKFFKAEDGQKGGKNDKEGKNGQDLVLEVPQGTTVINNETDEIIFDLVEENELVEIAKGGRGGFGNAHFKTSSNQAPQINQLGEPGQELEIKLELKLVADVAIVGVPSSGKSTLISVISNAKPKIADYPFTTLVPNLGMVNMKDFSFVVVDVPGLIKDAYKGKGLGDAFLRHIERSRIIIHLLDLTSKEPLIDYLNIREELERYKSELAKKPEIVALNKIDILGQDKELLKEIVVGLEEKIKKKVHPISAASVTDIEPLLYEIKKQLKEMPKKVFIKEKIKVFTPQDELLENIKIVKDKDVFIVSGKKIERIASQTNPNSSEGVARLLRSFDRINLIDSLLEKGIKDNHLIKIGRRLAKFSNNMIIIIG